ncbi:lipoyl(octanoyl) transferase LipB [Methyloligella solikamskensis]|uniref:Octanoyltransferase n=1 Tax=Methyloligella solikamskensis TaxID=1177756 RepID=A0ABW3JA08_9HYPH
MPTANFARMVGTTGLLGAELYSEPHQATGIEWFRSKKPVPYPRALNAMESRVADIASGEAGECVWLLEHPALYTAGTSADPSELIDPDRFPVYQTGRGGRYTYHGPGQRIAYVMLNLKARGGDVRAYVQALQTWLRDALAVFDVTVDPASSDIGVFVGGAKIASIGVRVSRGVTFHGISLNVAPDLEHFSGIIPCGLKDTKPTSLKALGVDTDFEKVDAALLQAWPESLRRS